MIKFISKKALCTIAIVALALGLTGCFEKVTTRTNLLIKVLVQETSGGENRLEEDVKAYAYYTGNDDWRVASYDDALNGIITDSLGVERRTQPDIEGVPFNKETLTLTYTSLPLTESPAMVVVVSPATRMYAYTFKPLNAENLPETYMTLIFHTWQKKVYTEGSASKGGLWYIFPPTPESDNGSGDENNSDGNGSADSANQ